MKTEKKTTLIDLSVETNVLDRVERVKEYVQRIFVDGNYEDDLEMILPLRWRLANYYKVPLKSQIFEDYTLEDFVLENELINFTNQTPDDVMRNVAETHKEEIEDLFSDWDAEESFVGSDELNEIEKHFMETGEFQK